MAQRPRTHRLETESINAFRAVLPSGWVAREVNPDYGIDFNVEIFRDDYSTGLQFNVQLKGTDQRKKQPTAHIKSGAWTYMSQSELPTIIVNYESESKKLHYRWHHQTTLLNSKPRSNGLEILFDESEQLIANSIKDIERVVESIRRLKSGSTPFPIPLRIEFVGQPDNYVYQIFKNTINKVKIFPDVFSPSSSDQVGAEATIYLDLERISASLPGACPNTIFYTPYRERINGIREVTCDILFLLGLQLGNFGYHHPSQRLFTELQSYGWKSLGFELSSEAARMQFNARHLDTAIALLRASLPNSDIKEFQNRIAALQYAASEARLPIDQAVVDLYTDSISRAQELNDNDAVAVGLANLALITAHDNSSYAAYLLLKARKASNRLRDRWWLWNTLTLLLVSSGRLQSASKCCAVAENLCEGEHAVTQAYSCLLCGRLEEARLFLSKHEESIELFGLPKRIARAVDDLRIFLGQTPQASKQPGESSTTAEMTRSQLATKPLDGKLWQKMGDISGQSQDYDQALVSYNIAAVLLQSDPSAWYGVFQAELHRQDSFEETLFLALQACGADFIEFFEEALRHSDIEDTLERRTIFLNAKRHWEKQPQTMFFEAFTLDSANDS